VTRRIALAATAVLLAAAPAWADPPPAVIDAIAAVDPACAGAALQPSAGGWIAACGDRPIRLYFARGRGGKTVVTRLLEQRGALDYDVRPGGVNASYREAAGGLIERSWSLDGDPPAPPSEIRRGERVCSAAQVDAGTNWRAKQLARELHAPTYAVDYANHRVRAERPILACLGGMPGLATRKGLVIPIAPAALELGLRADVIAGPPPHPGALGVRIAAQPGADSAPVQLTVRITDRTADPIVHGDPRTGDHLELWLAPEGEPSCDQLASVAATCTAPTSRPAAVVVWIAQGKAGAPVIASEPATAAHDVAVTQNGELAIQLSGPLAAAARRGIAVVYRDAHTGTALATANPSLGDFSPLGDPGPLDAPAMPQTVLPR
jgi:hypothetical protein